MNIKLFREILIIILLILVVVFALGVLFYDCIATDVSDIESIQYVTSADISKILDNESNDESIYKTYKITENDIKKYSTDQSYDTGKKDPFAEAVQNKKDESKENKVAENKVSNTVNAASNTTNSNTATESQNETNVSTNKNVTNDVSKAANTTNTSSQAKNNTVANTSNTVNNTNTQKTNTSSQGTFFESKTSK